MSKLLSSVACNLDADILAACYPLFAESKVEAIEWSFDALYKRANIPEWFLELLSAYANEGRLVAHGVFFSLFSGRWLPEQGTWLQHLRTTSQQFRFDHVTEHFGFMTGKDFHNGAPLNIPFNATTLRIGRDRLARIQDACNAPVGLENLAFSYSPDDVKVQGEFLDKLIEPVNGFIILDVHNLYCQLHNFSLSYDAIIDSYPLNRVREIHISGGSWVSHKQSPDSRIRRDTHDDGVPEAVFELLALSIRRCPNLKYVVMEQLGVGLKTSASRKRFYEDYVRMQAIVTEWNEKNSLIGQNTFRPLMQPLLNEPVSDEALYLQQQELSSILETAPHYEEAATALSMSSLAHSDWKIEAWSPYMLETAMDIAQKWKKK